MALVFLNVNVFVFAFYLQKPKISETAVQLKQHQLDNSKFPSGETRENSLHKGPMPAVSAQGFEWAMES